MKDEKWYCEIQAPPELHEHIEQLFNAISYKIRHADGYIEGYKYGLEKSIEPNLGNNGSICTKTGSNDEDRTTDDTIYRQQAIDAICKACSLTADYHKCDGYPEGSTWCEELVALRALPSVQPELIEQGAYVRGFEQGRTQGMIDAKEWKK